MRARVQKLRPHSAVSHEPVTDDAEPAERMGVVECPSRLKQLVYCFHSAGRRYDDIGKIDRLSSRARIIGNGKGEKLHETRAVAAQPPEGGGADEAQVRLTSSKGVFRVVKRTRDPALELECDSEAQGSFEIGSYEREPFLRQAGGEKADESQAQAGPNRSMRIRAAQRPES